MRTGSFAASSFPTTRFTAAPLSGAMAPFGILAFPLRFAITTLSSFCTLSFAFPLPVMVPSFSPPSFPSPGAIALVFVVDRLLRTRGGTAEARRF